MKNSFRRSMGWVHTWAGLVLGWILFFIFLTGTIGYFDSEIDRWMQPELPFTAQNEPQDKLINLALTNLKEQANWSSQWQMNLPSGREDLLHLGWKKPKNQQVMGFGGSMQWEILDHTTGEIAEPRETKGGQFLYKMHFKLHYLPSKVGFWIVGLASMFMLVALITGIIIHTRIFKDFFVFRAKKSSKSWLDAHVVVSVIALPFHLMITYSGLVFFVFTLMGVVALGNYSMEDAKNIRNEALPKAAPVIATGKEASMTDIPQLVKKAKKQLGKDVNVITIFNPNDKNSVVSIRRQHTTLFGRDDIDEVQFNGVTGKQLEIPHLDKPEAGLARSVFITLHEGHYSNIVMRWLYFIAGLLGTMMVATGMLLWVEKRRFKYENKQNPTKGYLLVQRLNAATIVGFPMSIAVYFILNRILPAEMGDRSFWEMNGLFISWGLFAMYPFIRPIKRIWIEMLVGASILTFSIPIISAMTSDYQLINAIMAKDWTMVGFDLVLILIAIKFLFAASRVRKRQKNSPEKQPGKKVVRSRPKTKKNIPIGGLSSANRVSIKSVKEA